MRAAEGSAEQAGSGQARTCIRMRMYMCLLSDRPASAGMGARAAGALVGFPLGVAPWLIHQTTASCWHNSEWDGLAGLRTAIATKNLNASACALQLVMDLANLALMDC